MRILGIDLSSFGRTEGARIRAIELESAFGRTSVSAFHDIPISPTERSGTQASSADPSDGTPEQDPQTQSQNSATFALNQLLHQLSKPADRIVTALPIQNCTFRNLQLPTRDKKAIQAAVGFELEDELPFPAEDTVFDYSLISQSKQGSEVHVSATLKRYLVQAIQSWSETEVEPDLITTEAWAFRSLMNRVLTSNQQQTPILLIHLSPEASLFYLHWQGLPAYLAESNWDGAEITQNPIPEGFLTEIRQIELLARKLTQKTISLIYVVGTLPEKSPQKIQPSLPHLAEDLEKRLGVPTQLLAPWTPSLTDPKGAPLTQEVLSKYCLPLALALTATRSDQPGLINFRKGEFSKVGRAHQFNFKILKKPMMALGIIATSLFLSLVIQSSVYRSRLSKTDAQLEKSMKSFYGQISGSAIRSYLTNPSSLRKSIQSELGKQREINRLLSPNPHSPLDFLSQLSAAIPKSTVTDLIYFQSGTDSAESFDAGAPSSTTVTFLISNPQMAEKLASAVGSKINNLQRGKMEEVNDSENNNANGKKWKITFSGNPVEN